jgi:hypothetical protein
LPERDVSGLPGGQGFRQRRDQRPGELGTLMLAALLIGLVLPLVAVALVKLSRLRSA